MYTRTKQERKKERKKERKMDQTSRKVFVVSAPY
jgi:hypothetical protein